MDRLLFIGQLNPVGRSYQRFQTLKRMGHEVDGISTISSASRFEDLVPFPAKIMRRAGFPLDLTQSNPKILDYVGKHKPPIVWIEKGTTIHPDTLKRIKILSPHTTLVSVSEDDMYARHNNSDYYRRGLCFYDIVFTTKTYNLSELRQIGAQKTALFLDAFDDTLHRPTMLSATDKKRFQTGVGFIGTFEQERAEMMLYLAKHNIPIVIWGNGWWRLRTKHPNLTIKHQAIYNEDYVKAIGATDINLCFLRKINRDQTTSRTAEIPACGGFMLAERTNRHMELFEDGTEALFFNSKYHLLHLIRVYLKNPERRRAIAQAGRARCIKSGY